MNLYTNHSLNTLDGWKKNAVQLFAEKLSDKDKPFPCIPATMGFQQNHFLYGFVSDPREITSANELATILSDYSKIYKSCGDYTSLIVFYETPADFRETMNVEAFEKVFWEQLNQVCERDPIEWPAHIPADPNNPLWEFCFHGEQYFMYCATPAHKKRMSRHFPFFMLAITPRWVLESFRSSKLNVDKIKANIRKRLKNYDTIGIHPDLNTYGHHDNYEWKQYFLHDDDTGLTECPFHKLSKKTGDDL